MKLFYLPGACSMVPHTALQWIGQPYEAEAVTHAQIKEPAYLAMNPQGAVPLLVDGDLVLSQNVAILAYLDARFPEARLFGSDTIEGKARAWRWLAFLNADVHKAFGQLFRTPPWAEDETVKNAMQQAAREGTLKEMHHLTDAMTQVATNLVSSGPVPPDSGTIGSSMWIAPDGRIFVLRAEGDR